MNWFLLPLFPFSPSPTISLLPSRGVSSYHNHRLCPGWSSVPSVKLRWGFWSHGFWITIAKDPVASLLFRNQRIAFPSRSDPGKETSLQHVKVLLAIRCIFSKCFFFSFATLMMYMKIFTSGFCLTSTSHVVLEGCALIWVKNILFFPLGIYHLWEDSDG